MHRGSVLDFSPFFFFLKKKLIILFLFLNTPGPGHSLACDMAAGQGYNCTAITLQIEEPGGSLGVSSLQAGVAAAGAASCLPLGAVCL